MILKRAFTERYNYYTTAQYIENTLEIITKDKAQTLNLSEEREHLVIALKNFKNRQQYKSDITQQIAATDKNRNTIYVGFKHTLEAWAKNHYDQNIQQKASEVLQKLKSFGKRIDLMPYQEKTATLNGIILALTTEFSNAIAILNLKQWVVELDSLNTEFDRLYVKRVAEKAPYKKGENKRLQKALLAAYKTLTSVFNTRMAIAKLDRTEHLEHFIATTKLCNDLTLQYNTAVIRSKHRHVSNEKATSLLNPVSDGGKLAVLYKSDDFPIPKHSDKMAITAEAPDDLSRIS